MPGYLVIDWRDRDTHRHQAVFELSDPKLGKFKAESLSFYQRLSNVTLGL